MFKILIFLASFTTFITGSTAQATQKAKQMTDKSAYDFTFSKIDGGDLPLSNYKGKAILIVNTASRCGFTKQYEGLQDLHETYGDKGLVVLGVPSNDFLGQEPGSETEIKKFCEMTFGITFPMTGKVHVKGGEAHPFFLWASMQENGGTPGWNFYKFLISPDGKLVAAFDSKTAPDDAVLKKAIEDNLPR